MKKSIYSHQFVSNGKFYLYNSETNFYVEISQDLYRLLYNQDYDIINVQTLEVLKKNRFIVNDTDLYNYYNEKKMKFVARNHDYNHLTLVIVPTTKCNFSCPYCFEGEKQNVSMTDEVMSDLISFVNDHTQAKTMSITWYGGEPLLAFNKIEKLTNRLKKETNIEITSHSIVTNGYLFTDKIIDFFQRNKLKSIQITLDGIKENHDKTRFLGKEHISTYDKILFNIEKVLVAFQKCNVKVRVNINKNNSDDFSVLYKCLHRSNHKNLQVYPGFIREETNDGCRMCYESIYEKKDRFQFYEKSLNDGVNVDFMPHHSSKGCMCNVVNSYIIGPRGEIYKCWNDVNHSEKIIGYVKGHEIINKSLFYAYHEETTPFVDAKCKDCFAFPICSGGCAWYRFKNMKEDKEFNFCSLFADKSLLEKCLIKSLDKVGMLKEDLPKITVC